MLSPLGEDQIQSRDLQRITKSLDRIGGERTSSLAEWACSAFSTRLAQYIDGDAFATTGGAGAISSRERGTSRTSARNRSSAALAAPSTGGAATRT